MAELALSRGDARSAIELTERYLRRLPAEDRIERATGLENGCTRASSLAGQAKEARRPLAELEAISQRVQTQLLRASSNLAAGVLAAGEGEHHTARRAFEDAADLFERRPGALRERARAPGARPHPGSA